MKEDGGRKNERIKGERPSRCALAVRRSLLWQAGKGPFLSSPLFVQLDRRGEGIQEALLFSPKDIPSNDGKKETPQCRLV
mmetsp:Transcript_17694/g.35935  ORF Transcript_17694/g.35935 Transcript_17694/m.35935 type:complete len:80 (+) Transcript_17694:100-339(+)